MNYYYLVASLPSQQLFAEPPMTMEALATLCAEQLSASDQRELAAVLAGSGRSAFGARHAAFEGGLRLCVAKARAERRSRDASELPEDSGDLALQQAVRDAFSAKDPMERERRFDAMRWRWLEQEAERDPFAPAAVFSYALRLSIGHAWSRRTADAGRNELSSQRERMLSGFDRLEFTMDAAAEAGA